MWTAVKTAALGVAFALASSSVAVVAQSTSTTTTTTTTTVSCTVGGLTVSTNYRYVSGRHGVEGSIYATCTGDKPACFVDTRVRDAVAAESISCDDDVIHESRRRLGVYMTGASHYWPQGVACYSYGTAFTAAQQSVFASAMDVYHKNTAVRFITLDECRANYPTACGGCTQKFQIVSAAGSNDCYATLGYAPDSRMDLNFGAGCFSGDGGFRVAVHELGHIIGLIHEHTHPNRQIVVLRSDLTLSPDNYMKEKNGLTTTYDSGSVMHYSRETGICIPKNLNTVYCDIDQTESDGCVVPTADMCDGTYDSAFGKASTLAASDIATIAKIYGSGGQVVSPTPAPSTPSTVAPVPVPPPPTQTPDTPIVTPVSTPAPSVPAPVPAPSVPTQVPTQVPAPSESPAATPTPVATPTPAPSQVQDPGQVQGPTPSPVAIQDPIDQSYNASTTTSPTTTESPSSWDNMNQQVPTTPSPITDVGEARDSDRSGDDDDSNMEARGAVAAPAPGAGVSEVSNSVSKTKKPHICDF